MLLYLNNKNILEKLQISDNPKWIPIFDDKPINDDEVQSAMFSKKAKAVPEYFNVLNNYDYTCYLDSKLEKVSEKFVEKFINIYFIIHNYALLIREHDFLKDNVWNEFNECLKQSRYNSEKDKYIAYINKQKDNGLSEITAYHCMTGFLIRNMKHPIIKNLNNTWFSHIEECGIECQISFFFVKQLFEGYIHPFKEIPFEIPSK